jgi:hypothetical protein
MGRKRLVPVDHSIHTSDPAAPPSGYVRRYWKDGWDTVMDSAGAKSYLNEKEKWLALDDTNSSTTPATCVDLSWAVEVGGRYRARWSGAYTTAATTTGIRVGISGVQGTDGQLVWQFLGDLAAGTSQVGGASGADDTHNQASGSGPGATFQPFWVECFFHADSTTLDFRFWSEVGGSNVTIKQRSVAQLRRLDD